jgi:hypothetical protein
MKTSRKERITEEPHLNNTSTPLNCQEKTLVSNNAIFENMSHFIVYDHCVVFKKRKVYSDKREQKRKPRGKISHFSKRARFRLFAILSMIRNDLDVRPIFVTLTYHYGHHNKEKNTKSQLHNFLVQLRNFDPKVQFIWRIELQKRGAPHYHLIVFPGENSYYQNPTSYNITISKIWHNLADPMSLKHKEYGCLVKEIRSYREACIYMSKYVAKPPTEESDLVKGKHWGNSRNLPIKIRKRYGNWDDECKFMITKIRGWLIKNGKAKYASEEYLNIHTSFTVFIDRAVFTEIIISEDFYFRDY